MHAQYDRASVVRARMKMVDFGAYVLLAGMEFIASRWLTHVEIVRVIMGVLALPVARSSSASAVVDSTGNSVTIRLR